MAVAIRDGWPARHPSPKKVRGPRTATTASFPAGDSTDSRTLPLSTYMTLDAASPCANMQAPSACSTRRVAMPLQSTASGTRVDAVGFDRFVGIWSRRALSTPLAL